MYPIEQANDCVRVREILLPMSDGTKLYTRISMPAVGDKFPIVYIRTPYEKSHEGKPHDLSSCAADPCIRHGYAVVWQHCRGEGDSEGFCIPYGEKERTDGLDTLEHIRNLDIYNGEIYLSGASYLTTVHLLYLSTRPKDIKGAVLAIQTDRMYFRNYRNGCPYRYCNYDWFMSMMRRQYPDATMQGNVKRPFIEMSQRIFGQDVPCVDDMLEHDTYDEYWRSDPRTDMMDAIDFPVLWVEGWLDYYIEGMFSMWERMKPQAKAKSAMLVGPWGHATHVTDNDLPLPNGNIPADHIPAWFDHIRTGAPYPYTELGKVNYYTVGADRWLTDEEPVDTLRLHLRCDQMLGKPMAGEISYRYDPQVRHGKFQYNAIKAHEPGRIEEGIVTFYSQPFEKEMRFYSYPRWQMKVRSSKHNTAFFIRLYLRRDGKDYNLTETITSLSHLDPDYRAGQELTIDLPLPHVGFTVMPGDAIRVDVSSDGGVYVPHSNTRGHWAHVTKTQIATNTILCGEDSYIEL